MTTLSRPNQAFAIFLILFEAVLAVSAATAAETSERRPNVLMILVDDLKPALGCYGDSIARTPNIDRLASRSLRFDRAYCNQAVCAPSRFTLMLGSHSTASGLYDLSSRLRDRHPDAVTLPQFFAAHGYQTQSLGKVFHIGHGNEGDPASFSQPHFHDKVVEYLDPASTGNQLTREEALFTNQKLREIKTLPRGAAFESPVASDDAYADGRVAVETVRRLREARENAQSTREPFFIVAGFVRPHLPFSAPKKYWDLFDPADLPVAAHQNLPADAPKVAGKRGGEITAYSPIPENPAAPIPEALQRQLIHGYYASTAYMDAQVGRVLDELEALGLYESTIVILWSDHGYHLGDHGIWTKHTNYEQATRIPLLIHVPGITRPGSVTQQPTETVDLYPTLADVAGLPVPTGPQPISGLSLRPVLQNPDARIRDHAFHAYPNAKLGRAIRTERYRLVEWKTPGQPPESAEIELYDYESDPQELRNLASDRPEIVTQLRAIVSRYAEAVGR